MGAFGHRGATTTGILVTKGAISLRQGTIQIENGRVAHFDRTESFFNIFIPQGFTL